MNYFKVPGIKDVISGNLRFKKNIWKIILPKEIDLPTGKNFIHFIHKSRFDEKLNMNVK